MGASCSCTGESNYPGSRNRTITLLSLWKDSFPPLSNNSILSKSFIHPRLLKGQKRSFSQDGSSSAGESSPDTAKALSKKNSATALYALLESPGALKRFRRQLESEHAEENLSFYICASEYSRTKEPLVRKEIALVLYSRFIAEGAEESINISSTTREDIRNSIIAIGPEGQDAGLFDDAKHDVFELMYKGAFLRFRKRTLDLVSASWKAISHEHTRALEFQKLFYKSFTKWEPEIASLFSDFSQFMLFESISLSVDEMINFNSLVATIEMVAERHIDYIPQPFRKNIGRLIRSMHKALIETLRNYFRTAWGEDLDHAWNVFFNILASIFKVFFRQSANVRERSGDYPQTNAIHYSRKGQHHFNRI